MRCGKMELDTYAIVAFALAGSIMYTFTFNRNPTNTQFWTLQVIGYVTALTLISETILYFDESEKDFWDHARILLGTGITAAPVYAFGAALIHSLCLGWYHLTR